jgi:hypothetical protein
MYKSQVDEINKSLEKTRKAIISIGCSFVQGQGAVNDELYENYKWVYAGEGLPLYPELTDKDKKTILKTYPSVKKGLNDKLDFTFMEYDNAFVNVLSKKYFNGEYTPINLGIRGCGNRASIKELYFYPKLNLNLAKEIIVIYCPSGLERFDFVNDQHHDHFRFVCMWPHVNEDAPSTARNILWEGYKKAIWSEKFAILEQIAHIQELMTWCRLHRAKLIITPAFDTRYDKKFFITELSKSVTRIDSEIVEYKKGLFSHLDIEFADQWPWHKMFEPLGHKTFAQLALANELVEDKTDYYFQFLNNRSPGGWITPCAHPGQKAHDLFAKVLHQHILKEFK